MLLRPYQRAAIDACRDRWDAGDPNALIVLPTGMGKTVLFAHLGREMRMEGVNKILVVAHRNELLEQAKAKWLGVEPQALVGIYQGARRESWADVICCSVQSCHAGRVAELPLAEVGLIVIDEVHHGVSDTYRALIAAVRAANPKALLLGVTATPYRNDNKGLGDLFDRVAYRMGIGDAIAQGWLAPLKGCRVDLDVDLSTVRTSKRSGDYLDDDLARVMDTAAARTAIVGAWRREMGPGTPGGGERGRPTAAFTPTVESAEHLAAEFVAQGIPAVWISGAMARKERAARLAAYMAGEATVAVNCAVLTEGWDAPHTSCVLIARPTKSVGLFCLDAESEILTPMGWLRHTSVGTGTVVAGFNPATGAVAWEPVEGYVARELLPGEIMMAVAGPAIDLRLTNTHRMVYSTRHGRARHWTGWRIAPADEVGRVRGEWRIPASGVQSASGVRLTDAEIAFIAWVETDGTMSKTTRGICISQAAHQPQRADLEATLVACGFKWRMRTDSKPTNFGPRTSPICQYTISHGVPRGADKHLRGWGALEAYLPKARGAAALEALSNMDERQWAIFLHALHLGDGSKQNSPGQRWTRRSYHIAFSDKSRADWVQSMCVRRGWRANVARDGAVWKVHTKNSLVRHVGGAGATDGRPVLLPTEHQAGETVWCVSVPSGAIIVRRNGKAAVVGNTQMVGRGTRLSPGKTDAVVMDCAGASRLGLASLADLTASAPKVQGVDKEPVVPELTLPMDLPDAPTTITIRGVSIYEVDLFGGQVAWAKIQGCRVAVLDIGLSLVLYPAGPVPGCLSAVAVTGFAPTQVFIGLPEREALRQAEDWCMARGKARYLKPPAFVSRLPATPKQTHILAWLVGENRRLSPGKTIDMPDLLSQPQASTWIAYLKARLAWARATGAVNRARSVTDGLAIGEQA